jgi:hypothetical protein
MTICAALVAPARANPSGAAITAAPEATSATLDSLANLTLTIGVHGPRPARNANTVLVPRHCPAGGYPFAAAFTYADGSGGSAVATAPCPAKSKVRHAQAKSHAANAKRRPAPAKGTQPRPRIGPQLQRHDPELKRRDRGAPERPDLRLTDA